MVMFPDDPNGAEKQRKVMEGANRFMDSLNKTKSNHKPTKQDQYSVEKQIAKIVSAIRNDGWNNGFNTTDEPWVKQLLALLQAERREAVEEFANEITNCIYPVYSQHTSPQKALNAGIDLVKEDVRLRLSKLKEK